MGARDALARAVRLAVDRAGAGAADALAAVVRERDRLLALLGQAVVHDVEELEERHVRAHAGGGVVHELPGRTSGGLAPDAEGDGEGFLGGSGRDHGNEKAEG
jgi:hypothetical protein